jgi:pantothenate kinase
LAPHHSALPLQKFDELLHLASRGQHANVDMLVQDIYGGAHQTLGLSGNLIASSFGKSATADRGTCQASAPNGGAYDDLGVAQ